MNYPLGLSLALLLCAPSTGTAVGAAHAPQPESKPAAAPQQKPEPKLLPWRERVEEQTLGGALGYVYAVDRGLELLAQAHPELADRVNAACARRAEALGGGRRAIEAVFAARGTTVEQAKKVVLTPELDKQLHAAIDSDSAAALKTWSEFENVAPVVKHVSLLYAFDAQHDASPAGAIDRGIMVNWAGERTVGDAVLTLNAKLPIGWAPGPKPKGGNIALRAVSRAGFGDEFFSVFADAIDKELTPEQEKVFWEMTLKPDKYEQTGMTVLDLKETVWNGRRAALVTTTAANQYPTYASRIAMRQIMFLEGRWCLTVQLMSSQYTKEKDRLPPAEEAVKHLDTLQPVWDRLLSTLTLKERKSDQPAAKP